MATEYYQRPPGCTCGLEDAVVVGDYVPEEEPEPVVDLWPLVPEPVPPPKKMLNAPRVTIDSETLAARKRYIAEKEWFKKQCDLFIKPPASRAEDRPLKEVVAIFKRKMRWRFTPVRRYYEREPQTEAFARLVWRNAPTLVKCCCPHKPCICRRTIPLLPPKILPIGMVHRFLLIRKLWRRFKDIFLSPHILAARRSKHTLIPNLERKLQVDLLVYRKLRGEGLVHRKGPVFCLDDCIPFYKCDKHTDRRRQCECEIDYKALVKELRAEAKRKLAETAAPPAAAGDAPGAPPDKAPSKASGKAPEAAPEAAPVEPIVLDEWTGSVGSVDRRMEFSNAPERVCDSYLHGQKCSVMSQTQYDEQGFLTARGKYTVKYATGDPTTLCTMDGAQFTLKAYVRPIPPPPTSNLCKLCRLYVLYFSRIRYE